MLAIGAGTPVVPVAIEGSADVLPRGSKVGVRPGTITVVLHSPIETAGARTDDRHRLRVLTERTVRATLALAG